MRITVAAFESTQQLYMNFVTFAIPSTRHSPSSLTTSEIQTIRHFNRVSSPSFLLFSVALESGLLFFIS